MGRDDSGRGSEVRRAGGVWEQHHLRSHLPLYALVENRGLGHWVCPIAHLGRVEDGGVGVGLSELQKKVGVGDPSCGPCALGSG